MRFRERFGEDPPTPGASGSPSDGQLEGLRREGQRFLAAGDEAITRALAGSDSEAFLAANRQQGGQ